jgi:hypothetical protein
MNDSAEVLEVLEGLRNRNPFFFELVGENGYNLVIGLGGDIACAQYSCGDGKTPYLMALANGAGDTTERKEFLTCNTPTPVSKRYCVPLEVLKQIVVHFMETGGRDLVVQWEEI